MVGYMAAETEKDVSGVDLLRQPATLALARYLNDLHSMLGFQAYLWRMIVKVDYGHGDPAKFPKPGDPPPPESAVAQMDIHSAVLGEMVFCRGVNSFLTYLADAADGIRYSVERGPREVRPTGSGVLCEKIGP